MIKYLNFQKQITFFKLSLDFETKSKTSIIIFISNSILKHIPGTSVPITTTHTRSMLCMLLASMMQYFPITMENWGIIKKLWKCIIFTFK